MFSRALLVAVLCVIAACSLPRVQAAVGLDISQEICASTNADTWKCLRNAGYSFAIIEGYQGGGRVNQNLARCVADARAAGFEYVDTYAWAAPNCPGVSGAEVANELMSYINANHVNVGMVWVDVEESGSCNPSVGANVDFYKSMTNQFVSAGWKTGVYSSPGGMFIFFIFNLFISLGYFPLNFFK